VTQQDLAVSKIGHVAETTESNALFGAILLWEHLRMKSEDDPEARIRELEQPLAQTAGASEAGVNPAPGKWTAPPAPPFSPPPPLRSYTTPPGPAIPAPSPGMPPPPLSYGGDYFPGASSRTNSRNRTWWILAAVFVIGLIALPAAIMLFAAHQVSRSGLSTLFPTPTLFPPAVPNSPPGNMTQTPGAIATPSPAAPTPLPPAGGDLSVNGINQNQTITCNNNTVIVSGISNKVVINGHCKSLQVSGVQNVIRVDAVDNIEVSGFTNQITYHGGSPDIEKAGDQNVVQQG
jgi:hypothetical protein